MSYLLYAVREHSYGIKKFYRLKAELPHYLQQRMLEMFRTPYYDWSDKKYWSYEGFVINMLPKGKVWLYLDGMGRRELICDSLVGKEVEVALKDFNKEGYECYKTFDAFCKARLNDDPKVVENHKQNGIPDTLWEKYKQRYHYNIEFDVTILPGGHLWLYLGIGNLRRVLICDTLKGEEIHMTLKEFSEDFYNAYQTVDSLCADEKENSFFNEHGSEYDKIWAFYAQRFNYQFDIQFENKQTELRKGNFIINFANGEILNHDDPGYFEQPSRPNKIEFPWIADDMLYTGHFYFDEEEVKKAFMDVYGNNPTQPGKLIIQVSKYNNWFDIYLEAGNKKYKFEKTKIHVFKQGVNDFDDKAVVIYDNHPQDGNDILNFIGE